MQHPTRSLRHLAAAAVVVAGVPVLSGCASNFSSQVQQPYTPSVGVHDKTGVVEAFNMLVVSGSHGRGTLVASVLNTGERSDRLIGVSAQDENGQPVRVRFRGQTELEPGRLVQLHEESPAVLVGDAVRPGYVVRVTLEYADSRTISRQIPVRERRGPYADIATS